MIVSEHEPLLLQELEIPTGETFFETELTFASEHFVAGRSYTCVLRFDYFFI